jgi:hypothetical protein
MDLDLKYNDPKDLTIFMSVLIIIILLNLYSIGIPFNGVHADYHQIRYR